MDHPHASDVTELFRLGVTSALRSGNTSWIARMRCQLARPLWESGKLIDAGRELDGAFAALDLLGDSVPENKLRASTIEFRGMLSSARGDWNAAAADFTSSREVHLAIDNAYGAMLQTYRLGEANAKLGDLDEAARLLTEAHDAAVAQHRARLSARTGFALGGVLRRLGRTDEARVLYERSLDGARQRGSGFDEARVLDALAELAGTEGAGAAAGEHRAAAEAIRRRNGLL
nr:tetratricopeptide repeat protein [Streptomyces sp. NBC_01362]